MYICDFAQKSKLSVLLIKKKSTALFYFFTCLVALNWTREFFPSLLVNTLQHSSIAILSTTTFFFTTPFYFFTVLHYTALLHKATSSLFLSLDFARCFSVVSDDKVMTMFL